MDRSNLISRIHKGGGEGWVLPQDFDWANARDSWVDYVLIKPFDRDSAIFGVVEDCQDPIVSDCPIERLPFVINYEDGRNFHHPEEIAMVRLKPSVVTIDALDAMRTLSQLDRKGGGGE